MYCQKCGKENPEDARFCMDCGADLSGYKVEISPKISVSAKAESGLTLKWRQKPEKYIEIKGLTGYDKLPLYKTFVRLDDKAFCPLCGNYDCLKLKNDCLKLKRTKPFYLYLCLACGIYLCSPELAKQEDLANLKGEQQQKQQEREIRERDGVKGFFSFQWK